MCSSDLFYLTARDAMAWYQRGLAPSIAPMQEAADEVNSTLTTQTNEPVVISPTNIRAIEHKDSNDMPHRMAAPTTQTLIIDNDAGAPAYTETGAWSQSTSKGYNGGIYRYAFWGAAATATWNVELPETGYWDVSTAFLQSTNRVDRARFIIHDANGDREIMVNQNGPQMIVEKLMDRYWLAAGPVSVTLDVAGSLGQPGAAAVISDAVIFRWAKNQVPFTSDTLVLDNDDGAPDRKSVV